MGILDDFIQWASGEGVTDGSAWTHEGEFHEYKDGVRIVDKTTGQPVESPKITDMKYAKRVFSDAKKEGKDVRVEKVPGKGYSIRGRK